MTYQESLQKLGETTERALLSHLQQYLAAEITLDMFTELSAVLIAAGQQQGRYAAELSFVSWLQSLGKNPVPVAAAQLDHYADTDRLRKAVQSVVGAGVIDPEQVSARLGRLAYAETVEASQRTFSEVMRESGEAGGWVRSLEAGACQLCEWWGRDGQEWPLDHEMPTHKGCTCTPIPIPSS